MSREEFHVPEGGSHFGDEALLANGWIKIMNGEWFGHWREINDKQVQILEKLNVKHLCDE